MSSPEDQQQVYYPAHRILRRINSLKRSSYDFPSQLIKCITGDGHDYPIYFVFQFGNVDDRDKMWFICYLHDVLGDLEYYGPGYRRFREELQNICRLCQRLPPSCTLNVSSLVPAANPTSSGPYETICGGSLNGSKVCAKKLRPFLIAGSGFDFVNFVTEHLMEAVARWKRLTHPNIVPFLGVTSWPIHFVSARAPGIELSEYITNHSDTNRLELLTGISNGLDHLHSRGVIHGDLGGPNIIVDQFGSPRIMEFGVVMVFQKHPPSQIRRCMQWAEPGADHHPRKECDVFSFGMVMMEVFTGQAPGERSEAELPERPTHTDLTDELWALMEKCWDKDPQKRPNISVVLRILRDCRGEDTGEDKEGNTKQSRSSGRRRKAPTLRTMTARRQRGQSYDDF